MNETRQKVVVINPDKTNVAVQGMPQFFGISRASAGAEGIAMNLTSFGPGGKSKAHYHRGFETAIYGLSGRTGLYYGPELEEMCVIEPGTFCFVPAGVPHVAFNMSDSEGATSISSRNDPVEQENVILMPELDGLRDAEILAVKEQERAV